MSDLTNFERETANNISELAKALDIKKLSQAWIDATGKYKYSYNWRWTGVPIIQLPQDILAMHEIIWKVNPTVIIETGIARGGSLVFSASQLAILELCQKGSFDLTSLRRRVIGIDVDIRPHNREVIESHSLSPMIRLIEGSSVSQETIDRLRAHIQPDDTVLVILDSNHTHDHVAKELSIYSPLVSVGSYIVVHDTGIEFAPKDSWTNRDWDVGNNPLTAVREFLAMCPNFAVDNTLSDKLLITSSPDGYLQRIR